MISYFTMLCSFFPQKNLPEEAVKTAFLLRL